MQWRGTQAVSLERILLLVIAGVAHVYGSACPVDVPGHTEGCLQEYNSQVDALTSSGGNFYTGVDVEQLRLICRHLFDSARCANNIKLNCPDTEHADIETILSEHVGIAEMCNYKNFFEVYARNQFCFIKLSAASEICYNKFRAQAEPEIRHIYVGDQNTLVKYCGYFDTFVDCIRRQVRSSACTHKDEAAGLVEILVRPSVQLSQHCKNETVPSTTPSPTTKKSKARDTGNKAYSNRQTVNGGSRVENLATWLLVTAVLSLSLAR